MATGWDSWAPTSRSLRIASSDSYPEGMAVVRSVVFALAVMGVAAFAPRPADAAPTGVSSLSSSPVTVYSAKWCSACRSLIAGLQARKIGFDVIDVDEN